MTLLAWILAQDPSGGLTDLIATYGPFAPFAALLLWLLQLLWKDNKAKEDEIRQLTSAAMDKVIPLVLDATQVLASAVSALNILKDTQTETKQLMERMEDVMDAITELQLVLRALNRANKRQLDE